MKLQLSITNYEELIDKAAETAVQAGREILKIYEKNSFHVQSKTDKSPLTEADVVSHQYIVKKLQEIGQDIPVLSEEGKNIAYSIRSKWKRLWIVDPLDGTKEFIKRNGEFTVNIALVEEGIPRLGVIYAPVLDLLYGGLNVSTGSFAWKKNGKESAKNLINTTNQTNENIKIVASRSHMNEETSSFIDSFKKNHNVETVSIGSSLKLCLVAEGSADIYPRFAPTMEWDTAAGDAILRAAGGITHRHEKDTPLFYNKESLLNPWFIAKGRRE